MLSRHKSAQFRWSTCMRVHAAAPCPTIYPPFVRPPARPETAESREPSHTLLTDDTARRGEHL
eukprot:5853704-Pleurochrysis_carterae.AAC.2